MLSSRTRSQTNKKQPKFTKPTAKPRLFQLIESFFRQVSSLQFSLSTHLSSQHLITLESYQCKLLKYKHLPEFSQYSAKLNICQRVLESQRSNRHKFKEDSDSSNQQSLSVLKSKGDSREGLVREMYDKERQKSQSYSNVITQQHVEMELMKSRINELEARGRRFPEAESKENIKENVNCSNTYRVMEETLKTQRETQNRYPSRTCMEESHKLSNHLLTSREHLPSVNEERLSQKNKELQETVAKLGRELEKLREKQQMIESTAIVKEQALQQMAEEMGRTRCLARKKEEMLQEMMYEKENYSDAYVKMKEEKEHLETLIAEANEKITLKEEEFSEVANMMAELRDQATEYKQLSQHTQRSLQLSEQRSSEMNSRLNKLATENKHLLCENKQLRLQIRTCEHKTQIYMQKYYKLQNTSLEEMEKRSEKSEKLVTAHTYEVSFERNEGNNSRKMKVLSDIKQMVRSHRSNILDYK